jgi:probable nitrogen fixation protein
MTTTTNLETKNIVSESPFLQELVRQIRAQDTFGTYKNWTDELVLAPFVVTKEQKKRISIQAEVEPITQFRITCFYRAVALCIEKVTGKLCQVVIDLNHEGFGWVLVWTGRLMVVSRTLRDAHRFGYPSLEKLAEEGEKLTNTGIELVQRFLEVTKL